MAPTPQGVLVIDEHGDRKWGTKVALVGRHYLASLSKTDNGMGSMTSLWADEAVYCPLHVEPCTPASHFARGKADPRFCTKRQIAAELVRRALAASIPCRAVVADSFYGGVEALRQELCARGRCARGWSPGSRYGATGAGGRVRPNGIQYLLSMCGGSILL